MKPAETVPPTFERGKVAGIVDVARLAGVSAMTVSRVMNGTGRVSAPTAERVRDAVAQLAYRPNLIAKALVRRQTSVLAVLIYDGEQPRRDPFFYDIILGAGDEASALGYDLLLYARRDHQGQASRVAGSGFVDGVIIAGRHISAQDLTSFEQNGIPSVVLGRRSFAVDRTHSVFVDYRTSFRDLTTRLLETGHRTIAIAGIAENFGPDDDKVKGCRDALKSRRRAGAELLVFPGDTTRDEGYRLAEAVWKAGATALISNGTFLTLGLHSWFQYHARRSWQNLHLCVYSEYDPALLEPIHGTSRDYLEIVLPREHLGQVAVRTLVAVVKGEPVDGNTPIALRVREPS